MRNLTGSWVMTLLMVSVVTFAACGGPVAEFAKSDCDGSEITDRGAVDVAAYAESNEKLGRDLPAVPGAVLDDVAARPYSRCLEEAGGDPVGVTSILRFELPSGAVKCDVVAAFEAGLLTDGWLVSALETELDGGWARSTHAYRGTAEIEFSIGAQPSSYTVFVDHDSLSVPPTTGAGFGCG